MIKNKGRKTTGAVGLSFIMILGILGTQPLIAAGDDEPVNAQFQSTGTIVLKQFLRGEDFMLLSDVTPLEVVGGHVAMKVPCNRNGETDLQILAGSASEGGSTLVEVDLEFIEDVSTLGRDCVYHADLEIEKIGNDLLEQAGTEVKVTDIVLFNSATRRVSFEIDNSNTVTVNLLTSLGSGGNGDEE